MGFRGLLWLCVVLFFLFARHFGWRCSPCKCVSRVKGCPSCFQYLISTFCIKTLFVLCLSTLPKLLALTCFLQLDPHASFEMLIGLGSFECPKAHLVHWQVSFPIFNGCIGLIFPKAIVPTVYLRNWALIAPIIAFRFLLDSCSFLLEAIGANSSSSFPS
jgi:hypothetical protein